MIDTALQNLLQYIEKEDYAGYDPYDTLNSWVPFHWLGKWGPVLAIQFQKRNPVNIRALLGIKKERNPKGIGLMLRAYSLLYKGTDNPDYFTKARELFTWLKDNPSQGYNEYCWGYNFPWASPVKHLPAFMPSVVATGFVAKGLHEYYRVSGDEEVIPVLRGAADFVLNYLPILEDDTGICISYTPVMKDACYNASLLGAEILARYSSVVANEELEKLPNPSNHGEVLRSRTKPGTTRSDLLKLITRTVSFVTSRQLSSGCWNYSIDMDSGVERRQIDFHQGYVIESIEEIMSLTGIRKPEWEKAIRKGLEYYRKQQFFDNGRSQWRVPKEWPVEIHNQAQGIITFGMYDEYRDFAKTIAEYTIEHMQNPKGYFYYQKFHRYTNKISYMRWSNAWMAVALATLNCTTEAQRAQRND